MENLDKKYILAVDDEPINLKLIAERLTAKGYRVIPVESGKDALAQIASEMPALVLLDIMMPEMDGIEVLEKIKNIDENIPVAMVTAVWDEAEAERCMKLGAYEYITKPIDMDYLEKAVLMKVLRKGEQ